MYCVSKCSRSFFLAPSCNINHFHTGSVLKKDILLEVKGSCAHIILNRPNHRNAISYSMLEQFIEALDVWEKDSSVTSILVRGALDSSCFSAGTDFLQLSNAFKKNDELMMKPISTAYSLVYRIKRLKKPYIALLDGLVCGGAGIGISIHGKYSIATPKSCWSLPETSLGLIPDIGASYFLPRLEGKLGYYLGLTGTELNGADVFYAGISTHFMDAKAVEKLPDILSSLPIMDTSHLKGIQPDMLYHGMVSAVLQQLSAVSARSKISASLSPHILGIIDHCFAFDSIEEIFNELHNVRKNRQNHDSEMLSKWAEKQIQILRKKSPLSLKVALEQFKKGAKQSLSKTLEMEYNIIHNLLRNGNFEEGIRAFYIDKDNNPSWSPESISKVSASLVSDILTSPCLQAPFNLS